MGTMSAWLCQSSHCEGSFFRMAEEFKAKPLRRRKGCPPGKMTYEEFLAWADEDTVGGVGQRGGRSS